MKRASLDAGVYSALLLRNLHRQRPDAGALAGESGGRLPRGPALKVHVLRSAVVAVHGAAVLLGVVRMPTGRSDRAVVHCAAVRALSRGGHARRGHPRPPRSPRRCSASPASCVIGCGAVRRRHAHSPRLRSALPRSSLRRCSTPGIWCCSGSQALLASADRDRAVPEPVRRRCPARRRTVAARLAPAGGAGRRSPSPRCWRRRRCCCCHWAYARAEAQVLLPIGIYRLRLGGAAGLAVVRRAR